MVELQRCQCPTFSPANCVVLRSDGCRFRVAPLSCPGLLPEALSACCWTEPPQTRALTRALAAAHRGFNPETLPQQHTPSHTQLPRHHTILCTLKSTLLQTKTVEIFFSSGFTMLSETVSLSWNYCFDSKAHFVFFVTFWTILTHYLFSLRSTQTNEWTNESMNK